MSEHCIAMTTVADEGQADRLATQVVEARLAACVQLVAIRSVYRWHDGVTRDDEQLLLMKTRSDCYAQLEAFVEHRHPYDIPEIVQVPLPAGLARYLAWIDESTAD